MEKRITIKNIDKIDDEENLDITIYSNDMDQMEQQLLINKISTLTKLKNLIIFLPHVCNFDPLLSMTNLESLSIALYQSNKCQLGSIKGLINLLSLNTNLVFDKTDLFFLPKLRKLTTRFYENELITIIPRLTQLTMIGNNYVNDNIELIKAISTLTNLIEINLLNLKINDENIIYLSRLINLESLGRADFYLTKKGVEYYSRLTKLKNVQLKYGFSYISCFTNIESLNLSYSKVMDEDLNIILSLNSLITLDISGCNNITSDGFYYIGQSTSIKNLFFEHTNIDDDCLIYLQNYDLSRLEIKYNKNITSRFFKECSDSILFYSITEIEFESTNISDNDVFYVLQMPNLISLNLDYCKKLTNKVIKIIGKYGENLIHLSLKSENFNDDTLSLLSKYNFPNLDILILSSNTFTDIGFSYFNNFNMNNLQYLDISFCKGFTIKGLKLLNDSKLGKNLKSINLERITVTYSKDLFKGIDIEYGDYDYA
jgi:hypothetical protein